MPAIDESHGWIVHIEVPPVNILLLCTYMNTMINEINIMYVVSVWLIIGPPRPVQ